jgi:hypothetical protein
MLLFFFDKNLFVFNAIWLSNNLCERCATIGLIYFFLQLVIWKQIKELFLFLIFVWYHKTWKRQFYQSSVGDIENSVALVVIYEK